MDKEIKSTHDDSAASGAVKPEGGSNHKRPADKKQGDKKADGVKDNKASVVPSGKVNKESFDELFAGLELSEGFTDKAYTLFEAALSEAVENVSEEMQAEYDAKLVEYQEGMEEKLGDYIDVFAENYMKDNELAIQKGIQAEVAESLINSLKDVFAEHNIEIPEDKVDIVESLTAELEEAKSQLNEEIEKNVTFTKQLVESSKAEVLEGLLEGVDDVNRERIIKMTKHISFDDAKVFEENVKDILEALNIKSVPAKSTDDLNEQVADEGKDKSNKDSVIDQLSKMM